MMRGAAFAVVGLVVLASGAWVWSIPPPAPVIAYTQVGQPVTLNFDLNRVSPRGAELSLADQRVVGDMFLQFSVSPTGGGSVTLEGISGSSRADGEAPGRGALPNWPFLRSRSGQPVLQFAFQNQLASAPGGDMVIRMTYVGPDVPLIRTFTVARPTTVPPFVSQHFGLDGPFQFERGTYRLDPRINGFNIPIRLLGR